MPWFRSLTGLLGRMGDTTKALQLIIFELKDVTKAIEFAMEENTDEVPVMSLLPELTITSCGTN